MAKVKFKRRAPETQSQYESNNAAMIADMQAQANEQLATQDKANEIRANQEQEQANKAMEAAAFVQQKKSQPDYRVKAPEGYWEAQTANVKKQQEQGGTLDDLMRKWQEDDEAKKKQYEEKEKVHSALDNIMRGFESALGTYQVRGGGTHISSGEDRRKAEEKDRFDRYKQRRQEQLQDYSRKIDVEKIKQANAIRNRQLDYNERRQDYLEGKYAGDDEFRRMKYEGDDKFRTGKQEFEERKYERTQGETERSHKANENLRRTAIAVSASKAPGSGNHKEPQTFYGEYVLPAGTTADAVNRMKKDLMNEFGISSTKQIEQRSGYRGGKVTTKTVNKTANEIDQEISAKILSGKYDELLRTRYGIVKRNAYASQETSENSASSTPKASTSNTSSSTPKANTSNASKNSQQGNSGSSSTPKASESSTANKETKSASSTTAKQKKTAEQRRAEAKAKGF